MQDGTSGNGALYGTPSAPAQRTAPCASNTANTADTRRVTIHTLRAMKRRREKMTMITAYDATFARLLDRAGAELLLVGDSLGMVVQGHDSTLPVTMDDMLYHCRAVARGRGAGRAHIVGDMPFMSYQASIDDAVRNAGRFLKEGMAESVKLEGGAAMADTVRRIVSAGIPVMGHIGLTPQSVHQLGGYKVQGKSEAEADRLVHDAQALEAAGAYAIVLETVPAPLAARISEAVAIPTIGIGAGPDCDGQVLVCYDLLGLGTGEFRPKFLKQYSSLGTEAVDAASRFRDEVRAGRFPAPEHCY